MRRAARIREPGWREGEHLRQRLPGAGPWTYRPVIDLELKPGRVIEVEIELIAGVLVEGRVVDAETGEPLGDVSVCVEGPNQPRDGTVTGQGRPIPIPVTARSSPVFAVCFAPAGRIAKERSGRNTVDIPQTCGTSQSVPLRCGKLGLEGMDPGWP